MSQSSYVVCNNSYSLCLETQIFLPQMFLITSYYSVHINSFFWVKPENVFSTYAATRYNVSSVSTHSLRCWLLHFLSREINFLGSKVFGLYIYIFFFCYRRSEYMIKIFPFAPVSSACCAKNFLPWQKLAK